MLRSTAVLAVRLTLVLFTLVLSACGGTAPPSTVPGEPEPGTARRLSATVADYAGAGGSVVASMQTSLANVATGTITPAGLFTLELPETLTETQLPTSEANPFCATNPLTLSTTDWAADFLTQLEVQEAGATTGTLYLSNRPSDAVESSQLGLRQVVPVYSRAVLSVTGICTDAALGTVTTYDLRLEPGWNFALQEVTDELGTQATISTVEAIPEDVSWRLASAALTVSRLR